VLFKWMDLILVEFSFHEMAYYNQNEEIIWWTLCNLCHFVSAVFVKYSM